MEERKKFFLNFIAILVILALSVYWFVPLNKIHFNTGPRNYNFSLNSSVNSDLQFYPNLRFANTDISFKIYDCSLQRKYDMERAFDIIEEKTILSFYPVQYGEEIFVTCEDKNVFDKESKTYVAGEGGPTSVTISGNFNIISSGEILLLKDSGCENPNIAIHELLHVLGFVHSDNPNNIMYEFSRCDQTIGEDMVDYINELYSVPTQPDLAFEGVGAVMNGKYLTVNFTVRNNGLTYSGKSKVIIIADEKIVKEVEIAPIEAGEGIKISLSTWVPQINVKKIEFVIDNDFSELDKINNHIYLEIKK